VTSPNIKCEILKREQKWLKLRVKGGGLKVYTTTDFMD
jgi:hypothetical protein